MACARDERHRYGQHYTPRSVARLLAAFAIRDAQDRVFDPGCGDGRLLEASLERKLELDPKNRDRDRLAENCFGIDRSFEAVSPLHEVFRQTRAADFFEWSPEEQWPSSFDAVIGNPPYIRQEVIGASDKARIARRIAASRERSPGVFWPEFSGRSDIYVFFFAQAINFLREGGRLVFLTSASWLDSVYGAALREFMTANFKVSAIIESAVESFFDDASINTVITVLERRAGQRERHSNCVRFIQLLQPVPENASSLAGKIDETMRSNDCSQFRARLIDQSHLDPRSGLGQVSAGAASILRGRRSRSGFETAGRGRQGSLRRQDRRE
jgi:type I restriction-modification system DNA methylase subunit